MTALLVVEEIEKGNLKLTDTVQVSDLASNMGGSQVFLKAGEQMTVEDLLKSVMVASANDASVALAETVAGSVEAFVARMNDRAKELDMKNTNFENPTGLDDSTVDHRTSARDIAIMSRELMKHEMILQYTTIWMDTIRDGAFGLTNTNRLIRFYQGANGLKTGSTSKAGFCISAAAKRDGMQLIAVVMGSPNRDSRNETAKKLLDYGFAHYRYLLMEEGSLEPIKVLGGITDRLPLVYDKFDAILEKSVGGREVETVIDLPDHVAAPIQAGDRIGTVEYRIDGELLGSVPVKAAENVEKIGYFGLLCHLLSHLFFHGI
jgi:D-alanyl-D-alanine carboxypeptidase (penicillin-binding protein 5/6)